MGNQTAVSDPDGNVTAYDYNQLNEVSYMLAPPVGSIYGSTEETDYTFDLDGNVLSVVTPNGNTITNTYDDNDRLIGRAD